MQWCDEGLVLHTRPHGESLLYASVLTRSHGRCSGMVRRGHLAPGHHIQLVWRARLREHLGFITPETLRAYGAQHMASPSCFLALMSACSLLHRGLPERNVDTALFQKTLDMLGGLGQTGWVEAYLHWEVAFLKDIGYGLSLWRCAATGQPHDLAYISPKTGRAVSRQAGAPYHDRLFPLPGFFVTPREAQGNEVKDAFHLLGHFLQKHLAGSSDLFVRENLQTSLQVADKRAL